MSSCKGVKVSELKYENVRSDNLEKINKYYEEINSKFNTELKNIKSDYQAGGQTGGKAEFSISDESSEFRLLYNHLSDINNKMNNMVDTDFTTIHKLLKEIKSQEKTLKNNEMEIDKLYKLVKNEEVDTMKNEDSIRDTELYNKNIKKTHDFLIFVNVLVFMVIVVGIYSLVYPKEFVRQVYGNNENLNNNNNNNNKYNNENRTSVSNNLQNLNNIYKNKKRNNLNNNNNNKKNNK